MRAALACVVALFALGMGLSTAFVQVANCERAAKLSDLVRETEMLECSVQMLEARCQSYVHPLLRPVAESDASAVADGMDELELRLLEVDG